MEPTCPTSTYDNLNDNPSLCTAERRTRCDTRGDMDTIRARWCSFDSNWFLPVDQGSVVDAVLLPSLPQSPTGLYISTSRMSWLRVGALSSEGAVE